MRFSSPFCGGVGGGIVRFSSPFHGVTGTFYTSITSEASSSVLEEGSSMVASVSLNLYDRAFKVEG